jgi:hypothetical protein
MSSLRRLVVMMAVLSLPAAALAQAAPSDWTFALHGFVSVSGAYQDSNYFVSDGQQSLAAGATRVKTDPHSVTFDVRQSRFNFSVKGPKVLGDATPSGVLEIDFFGGLTNGNYGDVSILNRMRLAYTQLDWGSTVLQFGQQNDLIFAMAPTSLSHIAFPLGYATGNLGWRRPGVFGYHNLALDEDTKLQVAWEIGRAQWADAAAATGDNTPSAANAPNGINKGAASGAPAVEGRVMLTGGKLYNVWVAAHAQNTDLNGVGASGADPRHVVTSSYHAGAKVTAMGLTLAATGFTGKNTGPLLGQFLSFATGPAGSPDVTTVGYWVQAGYNLTKEFSVWGFYGNQTPKKADALAAQLPRLSNTTTNLQAIYRDGGFGFSVEWINFATKNATYVAGPPVVQTALVNHANQYMATANYFF